MKIDKEVMAELNSFELNQLELLLETLEKHELYTSGLHRISGAYVNAEAHDIDDGEDHEENMVEVICLSLKSGEVDNGNTSCMKTGYTISRQIIGDEKLNIKQKLHTIREVYNGYDEREI